MPDSPQLLIEGFTPDELLSLSYDELSQYIFTDNPVVCSIGSGQLLVHFKQSHHVLIAEIAHLDGGGEGVLLSLVSSLHRFAKKYHFHSIQWAIHALECSRPNSRLHSILESKGFKPGVLANSQVLLLSQNV